MFILSWFILTGGFFYSEGLVELAVLIAFLFNFKQLSTTLHTMRLERKACENRNVFLYVRSLFYRTRTDRATVSISPTGHWGVARQLSGLADAANSGDSSVEYSAPGRLAEHCDVYVCVSVCLSARKHISGTTRSIFTAVWSPCPQRRCCYLGICLGGPTLRGRVTPVAVNRGRWLTRDAVPDDDELTDVFLEVEVEVELRGSSVSVRLHRR